MLELKHVSVRSICPSFYKLEDFVTEHNIYTMQDFKDKIDLLPDNKKKQAQELLKGVERSLRLLNREEREPEVFDLKQYGTPKLKKVDQYNTGSVLPIIHPLTGSFGQAGLRYYTIEELKRYLGFIDSSGHNYLKNICRTVGDERLKLIIKALDMYTEQVERNAELMGGNLRKSPNAFKYQEKQKIEAISDLYPEIIDYLINLEQDLWYGRMSPTHADKLLSSVDGTRKSDIEVRKKYTEYISNYTTLPELEEISKGRCRALNRFIKH